MPVTSTTCERCNGTGEYRGTRRDGSTYVGRCFACQGYQGPRYGRRSYSRPVVAPNAMAVISALPHVEGPAPALGPSRGTAAWQAFRAVYPAEYAWLAEASAAGVNFAASLLNAISRYGNLTPRQLAAVQRNVGLVESVTNEVQSVAADATATVATVAPDLAVESVEPDAAADAAVGFEEPVPARAPIIGPQTADNNPLVTRRIAVPQVTIDMSRIFSAFDTARASGLIKVKLIFGNITLKRTGRTFRYGEGVILVYIDGRYRGYVSRDNAFHAKTYVTTTDAELERVREIAADPQAAARTHGRDTGYCSCCRRLLTDPPSVMAGIGPICIRRFGWSF